MNSSLNFELLTEYGSTWVTDGIYLFLISPLCIIGFVLNMLSLFIIFRIKKNNSSVLYPYLKVYCINSSFLCLIASFSFLVYSSRFVGHFLNYYASIYKCIIGSYVATSLYFFGNILDILICVERLSIFITRLKIIKSINPYLTSLILFVTCCFINLPTCLRTKVKENEIIQKELIHSLNNSVPYSICGSGPLASNIILNGINMIIRDFLTLIVEIGASIYVIIKYKQHKNLKRSLKLNNTTNQQYTHDKRLTQMTLYLSLISILTHLTIFITFILFLISIDDITIGFLIMLSIWSITFKHEVNFFVFYKFNSNFRFLLLKFLNIKSIKINQSASISNQQSIV